MLVGAALLSSCEASCRPLYGRYHAFVKRLLASIKANDHPRGAGLRLAAEITEMRLALRDGDTGAVDRLIARLSDEQKSIGPLLVWSPEMPAPDGGDSASANGRVMQVQKRRDPRQLLLHLHETQKCVDGLSLPIESDDDPVIPDSSSHHPRCRLQRA